MGKNIKKQTNKKESLLIKQLRSEREFNSFYNIKIIDKLKEQCLKSIKTINSLGKTRYVYECPSFLIGFPVYNLTDMTLELKQELKKLGFDVLYINPNKLCISWN